MLRGSRHMLDFLDDFTRVTQPIQQVHEQKCCQEEHLLLDKRNRSNVFSGIKHSKTNNGRRIARSPKSRWFVNYRLPDRLSKQSMNTSCVYR